MEKKYDIFISYSRKDIEKVQPIVNELEARDFKVWLDLSNIEYGDTFPDRISEALDNSDSLLFMCTPNSLVAAYCKKEIGYARTNGMTIRVILVDGIIPKKGWFALDYQDVNCVNITKDEQTRKFYENLELTYQPEKAAEREKEIEAAKASARRRVQEEERKRIEEAEMKAREEELARISQKSIAQRITQTTLSCIEYLNIHKISFAIILISISMLVLFRVYLKANEKTLPNLHNSIIQYKENIGVFVTETWTIRVDMLNDSTLRYASWVNPNTQDSKPALILYNGYHDETNRCYVFKNGGFSYRIGTDGSDIDSVTISNDKENLKAEKIVGRQ